MNSVLHRPSRRLLVCTPSPPRLDARHGLKATSQLLLRLTERNDVALLFLRPPDADPADPAIADRCALVTEVPGRSRIGRLGWGIGMLRGLPPWATDCRSAQYAAALERLVDEWRPDVVELHLQAMAQYVHVVAGTNAATILVDHDPASAWAEDLVVTARGARRVASRLEAAVWRHYERTTRPLFDALVAFSARDATALERTAGGTPVVRIPLAIDIPTRPLDPVGQDPPTVLFVGAFTHPPNVEAALRIARTIFPAVVDRVPDARLALVGNEPQEEVKALASAAVTVHGSVPDVTPFLNQAAVVVAPLRLGGGTRLKVLEALAAGKALIATPRAMEGVEAVPGEHYLLAIDDEELVEMIVSLLCDPESRRHLGESARVWAERSLGWERRITAFERLYDSLIEQR